MAEEVIGLLFGVKGGGDIDGASGKQIVSDLTDIVNAINADKSRIPAIKFNFDTTEASKAVDDLKNKLKDIEKIATIKVTYHNGGGNGGKGGKGGKSLSQELQSEMAKIISLHKQLDAMNVKIAKNQASNGDPKLLSAYVNEATRLEKLYADSYQSFIQKVSANPSVDTTAFQAQIQSLNQIATATVEAVRAKKVDADTTEAQKKKYEELSAAIQKWTKDSTTAAKLSAEYSGVSRDKHTGQLTANAGAAPGYQETIESINQTVQAVSKLKFEYATLADVQAGLAQNEGDLKLPDQSKIDAIAGSLGITTEQYKTLFAEMQAGSAKAAQAVENTTRKTANDTAKQIRNISQQIDQMYGTISKNPEVKKMADDLREYMKSGSVDVGDLKNRFDELSKAAVESGANIETWGDKFKKTFAGKVRSALAGAITAAFTKYLREVYQNVVNIDKAITNLQIASGKSREEVKALTREYAALAKQLGATTVEVAEAADTWLRQGYSAEESNTLIKNSMMLSKLGQMESVEASTALTSAMKGYGVAVQDSVNIVDKLTKVDMEAAASAGDIATAMSQTAASAKQSGVAMDTLIGYIAVVKEVTQDGAESVGTFYKTLFARMNNVAAGNFVDDETGEALNDVESVLNNLGIALRDANGEFRNSGEVLDEVASRWETFNTVEQHAIATAFAGTRQQEKFLVLMQNYGTAMEYAASATQSSGTALNKYGAYTDSVQGKMNTLTATFEQLSTTILDSDLISDFLGFVTGLLSILDAVLSLGDGLLVKTALVIAAVVGLTMAVAALEKKLGVTIKGWGDFVAAIQRGAVAIGTALKSLISNPYLYLVTLVTLFATFADDIGPWGNIIVGAILAIGTAVTIAVANANAAVWGFMSSNPLGWILLAITAVVLAITSVIKAIAGFANASTKAKEESIEAAKASKEAYEEVKEELDDVNEKLEESKNRLKELQIVSNSGTITLVEQNEMDKLSQTITQLEAEKKLLEDIAAVKQQKAAEDAAKAIGNIQVELLSDAFVQEDNTFWNGVGRSLASVFSLGISDAFGYGISDWSIKTVTAEDYVNSILGDWGNATEQQRNYVIDFYNQLKEQKDMLTYYSGDNLAQWQQDCNDAYNAYYEFTHKLLIAQGNFDTAWNSIITMERFSGIQDILRGLADQGNLTPDALKALYASNPELKEFIDYLISIGYFSWDSEAKVSGLVNQINGMATNLQAANREAKSFLDILNEVQGGYDALSDAMDDMNEYGHITAGTLSTLLKDFPHLASYLTMTANGYVLASNALESYIKAQRDAYVLAVITAKEGTEAYETAYTELERFLAVIATLDLSQAVERERKSLESGKEAWENRLDRYKELIDIRKELLDTYAEELKYQKELEKKQRNVANLQTKLSVARLDASAAGQARVRELETELKEAQEELEDFTLEHAIDLLTNQLDNQYNQYENLVETKVAEITAAIEGVSSSISSAASGFATEIQRLIDEYRREHPEVGGGGNGTGDTGGTGGTGGTGEGIGVEETGGTGGTGAGGTQGEQTSTQKEVMVKSDTLATGLRIGTKTYTKSKYDSKLKIVDGVTYLSMHENGAQLSDRKDLYVKKGEGYDVISDKNGKVEMDWHSFKPVYQLQTLHSGGFVGGVSALTSNEEFAKLLKGEFVSTPAQMKRFMEDTLPKIANYAVNGGTNEFNAPLIEITCENVTSETMPELKRVVDEAVQEIKRELDSGMSRTGFKRTKPKRLT